MPATQSERLTSGRRIVRRGPDAVWVGGLCLSLIALVALLVTHEHGITGDEPFYVAMAKHPGGPHNFPYAYRVAVPWLVWLLPFREVVGFTIIGLVCIAVAAGALFELLREFEIDDRLALGLVVGFTLSPTLWIVAIRHFRSIDPASVMIIVLGTLFIVRRQRGALLITLTLGMAVRESTPFLIPFAYAIWARRPIDRDAIRDVLYTCLFPAVIYLVIRTQIETVGRQYIVGYSGPFLTARVDMLKNASWGVELRRLAYTYGPLWLVAPFALRDSRFARRGLVLVVLCLASMTYAYDWGRIVFLAAPVFYVAAGQVLNHRRRLAIVTVAVLLAVDIGYGIYLQTYGVSHALDNTTQRIPVY